MKDLKKLNNNELNAELDRFNKIISFLFINLY